MAGNDYEEKRDFVRMRIDTQVTYTLNGDTSVTHHGNSMDLSATGLYMVTDFKPAVGDQIEIIMNPSSDRLPPFVAEGKVIRSEVDDANTKQFNVSIELTRTS